MTGFEKYLALKERHNGIADDELRQYLTIVSVMSTEERNYRKHRQELKAWLDNIEKAMEQKKESLVQMDGEKLSLYTLYQNDVPVAYRYGEPWRATQLMMEGGYKTPEEAKAAWKKEQEAH